MGAAGCEKCGSLETIRNPHRLLLWCLGQQFDDLAVLNANDLECMDGVFGCNELLFCDPVTLRSH